MRVPQHKRSHVRRDEWKTLNCTYLPQKLRTTMFAPHTFSESFSVDSYEHERSVSVSIRPFEKNYYSVDTCTLSPVQNALSEHAFSNFPHYSRREDSKDTAADRDRGFQEAREILINDSLDHH